MLICLRTGALLLLLIHIISASTEDDVTGEIEGLSNFFNPFNWFAEDETASESPLPVIEERAETAVHPAAAPEANVETPSELLDVREAPAENTVSEVRVEGSARESVPSMTPISALGGVENPDNNDNRNAQPGASSPYGASLPGNSPYGASPGNSPYGASPPGRSPFGAPSGNSPYGASHYGNSPYGAPPSGSSPFGASPYGSPPFRAPPTGNSPYGSSPYRNTRHGPASPYAYGGPPYLPYPNRHKNLSNRNAASTANDTANRDRPSYRKSNKKKGKLRLKPRE